MARGPTLEQSLGLAKLFSGALSLPHRIEQGEQDTMLNRALLARLGIPPEQIEQLAPAPMLSLPGGTFGRVLSGVGDVGAILSGLLGGSVAPPRPPISGLVQAAQLEQAKTLAGDMGVNRAARLELEERRTKATERQADIAARRAEIAANRAARAGEGTGGLLGKVLNELSFRSLHPGQVQDFPGISDERLNSLLRQVNPTQAFLGEALGVETPWARPSPEARPTPAPTPVPRPAAPGRGGAAAVAPTEGAPPIPGTAVVPGRSGLGNLTVDPADLAALSAEDRAALARITSDPNLTQDQRRAKAAEFFGARGLLKPPPAAPVSPEAAALPPPLLDRLRQALGPAAEAVTGALGAVAEPPAAPPATEGPATLEAAVGQVKDPIQRVRLQGMLIRLRELERAPQTPQVVARIQAGRAELARALGAP